jgi:hypothetical protein
MKRNATRIFFLIGIVAAQSSCGAGRQRDCEKQIKEEIHPGVPLEIEKPFAAVFKSTSTAFLRHKTRFSV